MSVASNKNGDHVLNTVAVFVEDYRWLLITGVLNQFAVPVYFVPTNW